MARGIREEGKSKGGSVIDVENKIPVHRINEHSYDTAFKRLDNTLTRCDNRPMRQPIVSLIESYIESKKRAWSDTTLRSERHRLRGLADILNGDPETLWERLERAKIAPYARVTAWSRVTSFWQWAMEKGHVSNEANLYSQFRRDNARLFKNAYERRHPRISFEEAKARISQIQNPAVRNTAEECLSSGARWIDRTRQTGDMVEGKGGKRRRVSLVRAVGPGVPYRTFLRQLKAATGLKPHDLRKIFATHLWKSGFDQVEMCRIMGWNDFKTAGSYVNSATEEELMARVKKATGG